MQTTRTTTTPEPARQDAYAPAQVGDRVQVYSVPCRVFRVRTAGTVDVEAIDGSGRRWRVSGGIVRVDGRRPKP